MLAGLTGLALAGCTVTPDPISLSEMKAFTARNVGLVVADQEPIKGPIGLYEAMARALKYNLDFKVEMMNEALAAYKVDLHKYDMLPTLVANSGYAGRDVHSGGRSRLLVPPFTQSVAPSTSAQKNIITADLTLSWHILDFGLSYVRAKQAADKVLIAQERRRKVVNRIIEEVRTAYWRALSAQRLIGELSRLRKRVESALRNSRHLANSGQSAPLTAMTYERELLSIKKQILALHRDLKTAKMQLAALMNVAPGTRFVLRSSGHLANRLQVEMSPAAMMATALEKRPELRLALLKERINQRDAEAALLELLPGASIYAAANIDTNDFLFHNNWLSWGAKASWNAMRLFAYPSKRATIEAKGELQKAQALALTMAVMTQVHIARAKYASAKEVLHAAASYYKVQARILAQVKARAANEIGSRQALIREEMNTLVARARYDVAYANLQNAYAGIFVSIGFDPYSPEISKSMSVSELARSLQRTWVERGTKTGV